MHYILVHGGWQGGWCWKYLAALLKQQGHQVSCPDLPGHGSSPFPLEAVTYDTYYESIERELSRHSPPVILVAHSMSGMIAAPLLDRLSDRIAHLYLIAAFVPQGGQSLLDLAMAGGPSEIPRLLQVDEKKHTQSLNPALVREALYHDCSDEVAAWAIRQLQPQPIEPFTKRILWKDSGHTVEKRTYIFCENDRDVHPITQQKVLDHYPCRVVRLASGHFPFLSQPAQLLRILTSVLKERSE